MNPLNYLNTMEQNLCNIADYKQIPIAGNVELLPLCNMHCKMCYARMSKEQMDQYAPMHTWKEWLNVLEQAKEMGMLFLLLTGGEPFLYPDFKELYLELKKMGIFVSINTNGTLINDEIAEYLASDPPRRVNITLYGSSDQTYARLCGNRKGFTQVMNAIELLQKRKIDIKFNCSLTPYNLGEMDDIYKIGENLNIPIEMGYYMFPSIRENNIANVKYRLTPQQAAYAKFKIQQYQAKRRKIDFKEFVKETLHSYKNYHQTEEYKSGFTCRSGNSVFWINYDGTMTPCSFVKNPKVSVFKNSFEECWKQIVTGTMEKHLSEKCHNCKKNILCGRCAAAAESETGRINGTPQYYCDMANEYLKLLEEYELGELE